MHFLSTSLPRVFLKPCLLSRFFSTPTVSSGIFDILNSSVSDQKNTSNPTDSKFSSTTGIESILSDLIPSKHTDSDGILKDITRLTAKKPINLFSLTSRKGTYKNPTSFSNSHSDHVSIQNMEVPHHILHVMAGRNNTMVVLTDSNGAVKISISAGLCGLKKANRGSPDAGYQTVTKLFEWASGNAKFGTISKIHVILKGFGPGRTQAIRAIEATGWEVIRVTDRTPVRHGGCRPKKKRKL